MVQTCYFELPKPVNTTQHRTTKSFEELSISVAKQPDYSTDSISFTQYLESIAQTQPSSYDIIELSAVGAVSEHTQANYTYEFEEFKTADQLIIEAQEAYEAYRIQVVQVQPTNEVAHHGFILLWSNNFRNFEWNLLILQRVGWSGQEALSYLCNVPLLRSEFGYDVYPNIN